MIQSAALTVAMLPLLADEAAGSASPIPWLWIVVAAVVLIVAVVSVIAYRAGGELKVPICLMVTSGTHAGTELPIRSSFITIGSEKDNDIVVEDDKVSKHHARITYAKSKLTVADTNSLYGTFVNGERVERAECKDGDVVRLGPVFECRVALSSQKSKSL